MSSKLREKREPRKDATCRVDLNERGTSRDQRKRTRKRGKKRRGRPKRDDVANRSAPKVVDGVICLMTSKIYNFLGSIATEDNAFKPHTIAVDTCSGYKSREEGRPSSGLDAVRDTRRANAPSGRRE